MKAAIIGGAIFVILLVILGVGAVAYFSYSNQEVALRNRLVAEQKATEVQFDATWKIIQQSFGVASSYKDGFKEVYVAMMEGRYAGKDPIFNFVQESSNGANFDSSLYATVQRQIEGQRLTFASQQKKLIDLKREHDNLRTLFPGSLFLGSRPEFELRIVTSGKTDAAFATGKEDDISLTGK